MFILWYFSCVLWALPATLLGVGVHNGYLGFALYLGALLLQSWISALSFQLREMLKKGNQQKASRKLED